jgi:hypothetical protein
MTSIYLGYSGQVWRALYSGLQAYSNLVATSTSTSDMATASEVMLQSLFNGVQAINAADLVSSWTNESQQLASILTQPLTIDPASLSIVTARLAAYEAGLVALAPLVPQPSTFSASGQPIIPDMNLLGFYAGFDYETAPSGLTQANFVMQAQFVGTAFTNLANALSVLQGARLNQQYDIATREALVCTIVGAQLGQLDQPVAANFVDMNAWNQIVALPAMAAVGSMLSSAPFRQYGQQGAVIRYALLSFAQQISQFILILAKPQTAQINVTTLRNDESLMDVAARTLNDFEQWQAIAALNGLQPPYVGPVSQPGIAGWGTQLILPAPGTQLSSIGAVPSYEANFLGTDIYFGPLSGTMPTWTGDYALITGYQNLAWALSRRILTTLNTLIYEQDYGSRIPPEVGSIETAIEAKRIAAFGESALLSDPRVNSVQNVQASGTAGLVQFSADVVPNGFGAALTSVNEVITNLPRNG